MTDPTEQLERLAQMLREGLITRDEFDVQKSRLLGSAGSQPAAIGAYQVLALLGTGGMGSVYRARHRLASIAEEQGGDVAVKVMHPHLARDRGFQARFENEATVGRRLVHPGIVRVLDLIVDSGVLALVMELVQGRSLARMIGEEVGPIPWRDALPLFQQLLTAVGHAHSQGVVHRDLKPDNVLVAPEGRLKVLDFGIAKVAGRGLTGTGHGLGTVAYMAPEQYSDAAHVDARADIYALGMTLYEMLAGCLPWEPDLTDFRIMERKSAGDLPPPTAYYPAIPRPLVAAVQRAIAVRPEDRFPDTAAFAAALAAAARSPAIGEPAKPGPPPAPQPFVAGPVWRLWLPIFAGTALGVVFLIVLGVAGFAFLGQGGGDEPDLFAEATLADFMDAPPAAPPEDVVTAEPDGASAGENPWEVGTPPGEPPDPGKKEPKSRGEFASRSTAASHSRPAEPDLVKEDAPPWAVVAEPAHPWASSSPETRPSAARQTAEPAPAPVPEHDDPWGSSADPPIAGTGTLTVRSNPSGATVWVGDGMIGITPIVSHTLPAGSAIVRVEMGGYSTVSKVASIRAGQASDLGTVNLESQAPKQGHVSLWGEGLDGAKLYIDNMYVGEMPVKVPLTEGEHDFFVQPRSGDAFNVTRRTHFDVDGIGISIELSR